MSEEKTRTVAWESCLTEEQRFLLDAWSRTSADVIDVILGKVHVCLNPNCHKVFTQNRIGQKYCTKECGRKFRRKGYRKRHRKELNALSYFHRIKNNERLESDPLEYARVRELKRLSNRRQWEKKHPGCRPYKPRPWMRIPDWAVKGQDVVDRGSVFLSGNMSDEQVMAANDFDAQQKAGEERPHQRIKTVFRK